MLHNRISACLLLATCFAFATSSHAQENCVKYRRWEKTVFVTQPVTENRLIEETSHEIVKETKYRTEWNSEQRERTIIEEKPVKRTSEKVVRKVVPKKVTETKYRTVRRVENTIEEVTEMRDEEYTVRKPVIETVMRDEEYTVRKPITETLYKKEEVTSLKPKTVRQTMLSPATAIVPGATSSRRPRARWLSGGYYTDPATGQQVWRRPGLHWVDQSRVTANAVPVLVPQETDTVALIPETTTVEKPIEVTRFIDEVKTRKVPVEVERMVEETRTRKVPVTVRVPKKTIVEEEVPYQETRYVDEVVETVVPVEETVMKQTRRTEPYRFETAKWVPYEVERKMPRYTTKRVPYTATYRVPYVVKMEQPLDAFDRPVGPAREVEGTHRLHANWKTMMVKVDQARPLQKEVAETSQSVLERAGSSPATFDVGGKTVTDPVTKSAGTVRTETSAAKQGPGSPPDNVVFPPTDNGRSAAMKEIPKATTETAKKEPEIDPNSPEAIANRQLNEDIRRNFESLGLTIESNDSAESVASELPSRPEPTTARTLEETSATTVTPEPLEIDVDIPAAKRPDEGAASIDEDDTIEKDVDVSRPDRS